MLLSPHDIQYFQMIAHTKNLRAAAENLHVTQPALSHSLRRLEEALATALFERTPKGLKLTPRGMKLLEESKAALQSWMSLTESNQKMSTSVALRIGMHPSVATYFAGDFLRETRRTSPLLALDLVHGLSRDITRLVIDGELDAATVMNPVRNPGLVIRELLTDTVALVGTQRGLHSDHIVFDPALAQSQSILKAIERKGLKFRSQTHSGNLEVIRSLAETGLAVAILPLRVAGLSRVKLVPVLEDGPIYRDRLCFVCRPFFLSTPFGRQILEAAKAAAGAV